MARTSVPEEIAAEVLFWHDHTCCVCWDRGKPVQIHHINEDPSDHRAENLAVLCLVCHNNTQLQGGFGRKLKAVELIKYRDDWLARVRERRHQADKIAVAKLAGAESMPAIGDDATEWTPPSDLLLQAYIESLPDTLASAYSVARPLLDSVVRTDMMQGAILITDTLEQMWLHLSSWFPPKHFGGKQAKEYFNLYVASRSEWNRALIEPLGYGTGGREAGLISVGDTMLDIECAVVDTVRALTLHHLDDFDLENWERRWNEVKK